MKVYAIHCTEKGRLPKLSAEQAVALKEGMAKAPAANPGVTYNGTMFDPNTGIGVCDWEAPGRGDGREDPEGAPGPVRCRSAGTEAGTVRRQAAEATEGLAASLVAKVTNACRYPTLSVPKEEIFRTDKICD